MASSFQINIDGKQTELRNLTPHPFTLYNAFGSEVVATVPSSGVLRLVRQSTQSKKHHVYMVRRSDSRLCVVSHSDHVQPFVRCELVDGEAFDTLDDDCALLVSMPVADFICAHELYPRHAVLIPDTGPKGGAVRDEAGQIMGTTGVIVYRTP